VTEPQIGDVLVVGSGKGWAARMIRVGQALRGQPCTGNHVAILHHFTDGVPWALEGRPGGVGWVDARRYLRDKRTVTNVEQPKTTEQRAALAEVSKGLIGTKYDWQAIADDALESLGLQRLWTEDWDAKGVPGQVVCSSFAAWAYSKVELAHPRIGHERRVFPSDWSEFCFDSLWLKPPDPILPGGQS
jgi:ribonuclease HI